MHLHCTELNYLIFFNQRYTVIEFNAPHDSLGLLRTQMTRDPDIIRLMIHQQDKTEFDHSSCNIEQELKPPSYR